MKIFTALIILFFSTTLLARQIDCTTKLVKGKTDKPLKTTYCGAVKVDARNNGIKYRRHTKSCKNIRAEFFSIKANDEKFKGYCDKIFTNECYMIQIKRERTKGMGVIRSHIVFSSVDKIPTVFSIGTSGLAHKRGILPGAGTIAFINLSCRVKAY